jgi:protein-arginine kinase activator protein McsA
MTMTTMTEIMTTEDGHYVLCEDCELELALHEFVGSEDKVWKLCGECNQEAYEYCEMMEGVGEEEEEEELGCCVSCKKENATIVFMHLKNGNFELCDKCFEWADHEDDYGKEFQTPEEEKIPVRTLVDFLLG